MNIFASVSSVIAAVLVFAVIILIHEMGHFFSARALGIAVEEFSIGFGPAFFTRKSIKSGIKFSIRAIPMGGYVRFYGEDRSTGDKLGYADQPAWKRFVSLFAGAFANILTAYLAAVLLFMCFGASKTSALIADVTPDTPAQMAGILPGDRITSVDGFYSDDPSVLIGMISEKGENEMDLTVERNGNEIAIRLTPFFDSALGRSRVGIIMGTETVKFGFWESIPLSFQYVKYVIVETFGVFKGLIFGTQSSQDIMGFVGAVDVVSRGIRSGFESVLNLAVLISINLGVVNLLPLPAMDGGRLVFVMIEAIRGKPIDPNKEGIVHFAGFALLIIAALLLTYQDIARLIAGG